MPEHCHISKLIIQTGHSGTGMNLNEVQSSGFWIVNANSVTRFLTYHCVTCRSLRGKCGEQLMSELHLTDFKDLPHLHIVVLFIWSFYNQKV